MTIRFDRVDDFTPARLGQNGRLRLRDGTELEVLGNHPLYAIWADAIRLVRQADKPLYVEVIPQSTVVADMFIPQQNTILSVTPDPDQDQHLVACFPIPSGNSVSPGNPRRQELLDILRAARESQETLWVTIQPHTREILDARPVLDTAAPGDA